jgi:hypothetical protein
VSWAQQAVWPASARAACLSLPLLTPWARVSDVFFFSTPASDFFPSFTTDRIRASISSFPFLEPPSGYISQVVNSSASISPSRSYHGARETGHREPQP